VPRPIVEGPIQTETSVPESRVDILPLQPDEEGQLQALLSISRTIDALLRAIAFTFGWMFLALVTVIVFDVLTRKIGFQLSLFGLDLGSTRLQELEWHLHAFLFLTWIGYAYVRNAHVRIDVFTSGLSARKSAWLELIGCALFALPYLLVALPYAHSFFMTSFLQGEGSPAPNGLPARWVVKGFLYFGFVGVLFAVISVALRRIAFLFGDPDIAERAMPGHSAAAH
jgi:TRAP-type mannitol/chloroaromatic compound transport system permease small subunit